VYAGRKGGDYVTDPECCLETKKHDTSLKKNNEKLEATTVDNLVSTMKTSTSEKILRERMKYFVLHFLEGILYTRRLVPGKQLVLKNITMWRLDG
jgi:hypothetical protein